VEFPCLRWYQAIPKRVSRRFYDGRPLAPEILEQLRRVCSDFRPFPGARAVLLNNPPSELFRSLGPFGRISRVPCAVVFIGDKSSPDMPVAVGYTGEGIMLEATALGLSTCWVGGFFNPSVAASLAKIAENETIPAITPIGYTGEESTLSEKLMKGFARGHKRKPLAKLTTEMAESAWPEWTKKALEAARLAPSAVNRQPWRFRIQSDSITVFEDRLTPGYNISKRLDCGIAMMHIEAAARSSGINGRWEFGQAPEVARFTVIK
jgi:hypothetical protein